jgi:hypothetical protein
LSCALPYMPRQRQSVVLARNLKVWCVGLLLVTLCCDYDLGAQTPPVSSAQATAFVQGFYDWYLHKQNIDTAIRQRPEAFDVALLRALRQDATARRKATGEIDGLDFDPFLNSQDPSKHFKIVGAEGSRVTVIGYEKNIDAPRERISAQVSCTEQRCVFVNFYYPGDKETRPSNLIAILNLLHPGRKLIR